MLTLENTALILIDIQEKLLPVMHEKEELLNNLKKLIAGLRALNIPILWTEQIPDKMGPTVPEIWELLEGYSPLSKSAFSCCGEHSFTNSLNKLNRKQLLIAGIETHVCVYQTALDLIEKGYEVEIPEDCVSSRTQQNKSIALAKMSKCGATLTGVETILFELMRDSFHPAFRQILKIVK